MPELLPPDLPAYSAAIMIVSSFFTSMIMAATGFGGGVLLLSIMASMMPIAALIPVHGVVQLGSNVGRTFLLRKSVQWSYLVPFLLGSIVGALAGGKMVVTLNDAVLRIGLAIFIIYAVWGPKPKFNAAGARWLIAAGGAFSTFLTMFFGATGPFVLAIQSQIPLLPVSVSGTFPMMPKHTLKIQPGPVKLVVHPPVPVCDYPFEQRSALVDKIHHTIAAGLPEHER